MSHRVLMQDNCNKQNKNNRIMYNEKGILGNQLVVMSREDFDNLVNEAAQNMVAAQTKKNDYSEWLTLPDGDRFISREEASELLRVDFSTLWRWNKLDILLLFAKRVI